MGNNENKRPHRLRSVPFLIFRSAGLHICTLAFLLLSLNASSQIDSCKLRISLLTCGPGQDLYSLFGHSAFRATDSSANMDVVFNYGTMDFDDPAFYLKFTRGEMLYFLSVSSFRDFMSEYQVTQRDVTEQVLTLDCYAKERLFAVLRENAKEENKYYNYEFLFNNCSSKLRDMLRDSSGNRPRFKNILPPQPPSFRNMIHEYLNKGQQYWSKFGIDLLLGSNIDKTVTNEQAMFLPDYLMKGFDSAVVSLMQHDSGETSLVKEKKIIYKATPPEKETVWFTPFVVFSILLVTGLALSFSRSTFANKTLLVLDTTLFLVAGLLGALLVFLWAGRTDTVCRNNFNLLWALPTHTIIAFFLRSKKLWVSKYMLVTAGIGALLLLSWLWLPQELNVSFIPIILLLIFRSLFIAKKNKYGKKAGV